MAAANTDKLRKGRSNFSTTLNGSIGSGDTTIVLSSSSGLPTDTAVTLTIDRVDANATSTPTLRERVTGVISGNNITNALRGRDNTTAQSHASGAVVEDIWDGARWNDHIDNHLVEHNQDGTHNMTASSRVAGQYVADTGAANAYAIAPSPAITAYAAGQMFIFKATNANTATSTLNVNSLGTKTIVKGDASTVLSANDILANQICVVVYDGTSFQLIGKVTYDTNKNIVNGNLSGTTTNTKQQGAASAAQFTQNVGEYDNGNSGASKAIDWSKGDRQKVTMTAACTFTYSNAVAGQTLILRLVEDGTGGWAVTLPTSKWPGGVAGTFTTTASAINLLIVYYDGTNYLSQLAAGFS